MENWLIVFIILYYLSLIAEIAWIPVPSVASTWQLVFPEKETQQILNEGSLLFRIQNYSLFTKTLIIIIPYLLAMMGYCYPLIRIALHYTQILELNFNNNILIVVGVILLIIGRLITIYAALRIRKNNSQKEGEFELKTEGIFKSSRNPIVIGLHAGILGLNLLIPNPVFMVLTLFYIGNIHFKILLEEDFLKQLFKGNFEQYISKTKRYL